MSTIFEFAKVADWDDRLDNLASMAEPERWRNLHVPAPNKLPILDRYVKNTFKRAFEQQRVAQADRLACFNTGLLTEGHEELFGLFTISETFDPGQPIAGLNKKWWLKSWVRAGDRTLTDFIELPQMPDYWHDSRELIFDPKVPVQLNSDHIVRDNLNRFPEEFGGCVNSDGVPTDLVEQNADIDFEAEPVTVDRSIPLITRNALEGAMKHSLRLAQRSYRIAVPQFYRGKIQLLLPIFLRDAHRPDLALTIERHGGWYRGATVLYTDWAYTHARLLARPNSEWLGGFPQDLDLDQTG